jgi:hypothetical protein
MRLAHHSTLFIVSLLTGVAFCHLAVNAERAALKRAVISVQVWVGEVNIVCEVEAHSSARQQGTHREAAGPVALRIGLRYAASWTTSSAPFHALWP